MGGSMVRSSNRIFVFYCPKGQKGRCSMKWLNGYRMKLLLVGVVAAVVGCCGRTTVADFVISEPVCVSRAINSEGCNDTQGCSFLHDGLKLYFAHNRPGGYGGKDIWVAARETIDDDWGEPVNLGSNINNSRNEAYPTISPDDLEIYFHPSYASTTLLRSTRASKDDPWGPTEVFTGFGVPACGPDFSPDGLTVYFDSNRSGGYGGWDIWMATRETITAPWGEPVNLGPNINDSRTQYFASISNDGLALFYNNGSFREVSVSTRATKDDEWGPPVLLGPAVNGSKAEISPDGSVLYVDAGARSGGFNKENFWQVSIKPVVDLNGDGIVDSADMCIIVDYWGTDEPSCDIGPMPWGDGIVDVQDLIILAEHLFEEILPDELIAYWTLDETEGDVTYNSTGYNHGILSGNPTLQPDSGQVAGALELDGIDDYISTDFILDPSLGAFSVLVWVKGGAPGQVIISQSDGTGTGNTWLGLDVSGGNLMTGLVPPSVGWVAKKPLVSESIISDGQWHNIGFVWDGSYRILYVDGIEVAKDNTAQNPLKPATGGLHIGAGKTLAAGTFFSGLIDDVRIYNQALTTEQIAALSQ